MHHADADVRLADLDVAHLLIGELLGDRFLRVRLQLAQRNVGPGTHVARRLRIGGVDLRLREEAADGEQSPRESDQNAFHSDPPAGLQSKTRPTTIASAACPPWLVR